MCDAQPRRQRGEEDCAASERSIFPEALRDRLRGDLNVGAVQIYSNSNLPLDDRAAPSEKCCSLARRSPPRHADGEAARRASRTQHRGTFQLNARSLSCSLTCSASVCLPDVRAQTSNRAAAAAQKLWTTSTSTIYSSRSSVSAAVAHTSSINSTHRAPSTSTTPSPCRTPCFSYTPRMLEHLSFRTLLQCISHT